MLIHKDIVRLEVTMSSTMQLLEVPAKACSLSHQRPEGSEMLTVHLIIFKRSVFRAGSS